MSDTIYTLIGGIVVAIITVGGGTIGSWLLIRAAREKTKAETAQAQAEAAKTLEEAKKLKLEAEAMQTSMQSKQDEAEREAQDRISSYWKKYATDLENMVRIQGEQIALLQKRDTAREEQLKRAQSAFEFLCGEVEREYPSAVKIAREIMTGQTVRGDKAA